MSRFILIAVLTVLASACDQAHLETFPPISNPALLDKKFPVKELFEDIDALIAGMKERHPAYSEYASEHVISQKVRALKSTINQPLTRAEFYRHIGQLSHLFNDGHSFLLWPYQEYSSARENGYQSFPFAVKATNQGLLLKYAYHEESQKLLLPRGAKILSINERPVSDMIEHMQSFMGGETRRLRDNVVVYRFPQALWSIYGDKNGFKVELTHDGRSFEVLASQKQDWQVVDQREIESEQDFYFNVLTTPDTKRKVGYLHIGTFDVDVDWFSDFIDDTFTDVREQKISSLIVDIRGNGGGNTDSAEYLTQYLADREFRMVSSLREKLNKHNRGLFGYRGDVGTVTDEPWTDWQSPMPESKRYKGTTFLLINAISYSSSIVFATTLKDYGFATLIGQETGGFANQTGQGNFFNLPNTELRAYVPTRVFIRPSGNEKVKGVTPHVITQSTQADLAAGVDIDVSTVLKLIDAREEIKVM